MWWTRFNDKLTRFVYDSPLGFLVFFVFLLWTVGLTGMTIVKFGQWYMGACING